jgi:hypothetical protein
VSKLKTYVKNKLPFILKAKRSLEDQTALFNAQLSEIYKARQMRHPNPLCKYGKRVFCQSDEDGLTIEIVNRLNIQDGSFIEIGVGNGTENNTLILLSLGFSGAWIGGEDLAFNISANSQKLNFQKAWVTLDNIKSLVANAQRFIGRSDIDFISIDLDGNDYHFLKELLENGISPKVFICEINGIFPPPVKFTVNYNASHEWLRDDYQGASLSLINELLEQYQYKLIVCNAATGANAYFIKDEYSHLFPEVPENIDNLYVEPLHINYTGFTFPRSIKTIKTIIDEYE